MNIVVAEDDRLSLRMLQRALEEEGHAVTPVASVQPISGACARPETEVLLCDINLGAGDGVAAALEVRRENPGVDVVIMTADPDEAERAARAGFERILLKPFAMEQLEEILGTLARSRR